MREPGLNTITYTAAGTPVQRRLKACVEQWPQCQEGEYNPACCRFPKSCSCTSYDLEFATEDWLEPVTSKAPVKPREVLTFDVPGEFDLRLEDYPWFVFMKIRIKAAGAGTPTAPGEPGEVVIELYDRDPGFWGRS